MLALRQLLQELKPTKQQFSDQQSLYFWMVEVKEASILIKAIFQYSTKNPNLYQGAGLQLTRSCRYVY